MTKHGIKGGHQAGCDNRFDYWGAACRAPAFQQLGEHTNEYQFIAYDLERNTNIFDNVVGKEIRPELWSRSVGQTWPLNLAKLPGTPSALRCNPSSAISSHADESFSVTLAPAGKHFYNSLFDQHQISQIRYMFSTRGIYLDGRQTWINVRTTESYPNGETRFIETSRPTFHMQHGDHHIVNIDSQEQEGHYQVGFVEGHGPFGNSNGGDSNANQMEEYFTQFNNYSNVFEAGLLTLQQQPACHQWSFGRHYFITSGYAPGKTNWFVSRTKYRGRRFAPGGFDPADGSMEDGIEVFHSYVDNFNGDGDLGHPDTVYAGNYIIMLPTCRVYIDSAVENWENGADECWVAAIRKQSLGGTKLVTGQWFSRTFRSQMGSVNEREQYGYADGTITNAEVTNVIVDADNSGHQSVQDFPDESWNNLKLDAYNRVFDPSTGHNVVLMLLRTKND